MSLRGKHAAASDPPSGHSAGAAAEKVRFGIGSKLQLAFGVVAVMTVIAATVAIVSFSATEDGFRRVARNEVPAMTDALRLSAISGEISTAAARLVNAKTENEQSAIATVIADRSESFSKTIARLRTMRGSDSAFIDVENTAKKLEVNLIALKKAISERTEMRAKLERQLADLHKIHSQISDKLTPIVDDSYFNVAMAADDVGKTGDRVVRSIVDGDLPILRALVEIESEVNLETGLLTASALTSSPSILSLLGDRFTSSAQHVQELMKKLPSKDKFVHLKSQIEEMLKFANFKAGPAAGNKGGPDQLKKIFGVQESLTDLLVTMVDDLNFKVVTHGEAAATRTSKVVKELVNRQIAELRDSLETVAQTHLIVNLLSEGALTKEAVLIVPIRDRFKASADLLAKSSAVLKDKKIRVAIAQLIKYGTGSDSVFALHRRELQADSTAERTVKENAALQSALNKAVAVVVGESESSMNQSADELMNQLHRNRTALLIDAIISLLIAAGIAILYVQRNVVRRLAAIGEAMHRLSSGETDLTVPATDDHDEIGNMARAVLVFRDAAIAKAQLENEAEDQRRLTEEERQKASEKVDAVRRKTAESQASATLGISAMVKRNAENARQASQFASETRDIAGNGGQVVANVVAAMGRIDESSGKISEIIGVIDEIARQTNLLALNAAVEAARAGEAGRGFAVVASEVRSLAQRSSQAAKEITTLITNSNGLVKDGVDLANRAGESLGEIVESIRKVAEIVSEVAEAGMEQVSGLEEINKALTQMDDVVVEDLEVEDNNRAARGLHRRPAQAMRLQKRVARVA